ncbi:MAG: DUF839 domain-containing protein [Pseudomonadota bacterium]|nr:DUF839 domain-containing protein [Pseudomonadota bacterium]
MKRTLLATLVVAASTGAHAIEPFDALSAPGTASNTNESTNPFVLPDGWTQTLITDRNTLSGQAGFQSTFGNWDMVDVDPSGRYIYIPFEVQTGAGVARYDRVTGVSTTLMGGNNTGIFESDPTKWNHLNDDFGAFDPAVLTPTGSLIVAEEWAGNGRIFEVHNPESAVDVSSSQVDWLSRVPSVSHEGLKFDNAGNLYFVDESNTGSIYKYVPRTAGDLSSGQTFVMSVDAFAGDAAANYNSADTRTGVASWVAITDEVGNAITGADPFDFTTRGGRAAADEVGGTPYGRPEDLEVGTLANGNEVLFWATTSENIVYGMELASDGSIVSVFEAVNSHTTPDSLGNNPVGEGGADDTYGLDDPDNLFVEYGPNGELQLFIIEDENPGDIWMATDADADGVAELVELFASLGPFGSEPTGFIADPLGGYLVNIQHPSSGNDALWRIHQEVAPVPVPAAVWLFGSAMAGLVARRKRS